MNNNFPEIQELLQQRKELQTRLELLPYDGSPEIKVLSGRQYLYIRKRRSGRLTSTYVGPYTDFLHETLLRNAREARQLKKQIRGLEKKLAQAGYTGAALDHRVLENIDFARVNLKYIIHSQSVLEGGWPQSIPRQRPFWRTAESRTCGLTTCRRS